MRANGSTHNGEDYDDLFERNAGGFRVSIEVSEPAIDQQLGVVRHNPEYLERVFKRGQRYMYHISRRSKRRRHADGIRAACRWWRAPTNVRLFPEGRALPGCGNSFRAPACASA